MKFILTVFGQDQVGIVARVSAVLAAKEVNILDISQTIMEGNFTMMMAVLVPDHVASSDLSQNLAALGRTLKIEINLRNAKLFEAMHTI